MQLHILHFGIQDWARNPPTYDVMAEVLTLLEHVEIYRVVQERKRRKDRKTISLDTLLKE